MTTVCLLAYTTNQQILITICYIRPLIHSLRRADASFRLLFHPPRKQLFSRRVKQEPKNASALRRLSHPQHVKNSIPFSQFLRLRRLCSDDFDFNNKCEVMCQFFKKRDYPDSTVTTGKYRAQEIDRQIALQTSQNEETNRIPFTLTYHSLNLAIKNAILKNFKILRNDPKLNTYFLYHHLFHSNVTKT